MGLQEAELLKFRVVLYLAAGAFDLFTGMEYFLFSEISVMLMQFAYLPHLLMLFVFGVDKEEIEVLFVLISVE